MMCSLLNTSQNHCGTQSLPNYNYKIDMTRTGNFEANIRSMNELLESLTLEALRGEGSNWPPLDFFGF